MLLVPLSHVLRPRAPPGRRLESLVPRPERVPRTRLDSATRLFSGLKSFDWPFKRFQPDFDFSAFQSDLRSTQVAFRSDFAANDAEAAQAPIRMAKLRSPKISEVSVSGTRLGRLGRLEGDSQIPRL